MTEVTCSKLVKAISNLLDFYVKACACPSKTMKNAF